MLPDTDWRAEDQPGVRARTSGGNDNNKGNDDDQDGDISRGLQRRETLRRNQPSPRNILTVPDGMSKVKGDAPGEACVAGPVVTRAQAKKCDKVQRLKAK